jgi:hypothetical protein
VALKPPLQGRLFTRCEQRPKRDTITSISIAQSKRLCYKQIGAKIGKNGKAGADRVRSPRILGMQLQQEGFGYNKVENSTKNRRKIGFGAFCALCTKNSRARVEIIYQERIRLTK